MKEDNYKAWWDFCDVFGEGELKDSFPNLVGYEKMEEVEQWAKQFPDVKIARCDDNHWASSLLILIPNPKMGIFVLFIPQLTYEKDYFFLYPSHQRFLIDALKSIEIIDPLEEKVKNPLNFKDFKEKEDE